MGMRGMTKMNDAEFQSLVKELAARSDETEWLEFKHNKAYPDEIGENISAISNSAAILGKPCGYILWGIKDKTHEIAGTKFKPRKVKKGNEELESWLHRLLTPNMDFRFHEGEVEGQPVVLLEVPPASNCPVSFKGNEHLRIGSCTKKLKDFPEKERALRRVFDQVSFEKGIALQDVPESDVTKLIGYQKYFQLMDEPVPEDQGSIIYRLESERVLIRKSGNRFDICNVGAALFAMRLDDFPSLSRKAIRVITYEGSSRVETIKEQTGSMIKKIIVTSFFIASFLISSALFS